MKNQLGFSVMMIAVAAAVPASTFAHNHGALRGGLSVQIGPVRIGGAPAAQVRPNIVKRIEDQIAKPSKAPTYATQPSQPRPVAIQPIANQTVVNSQPVNQVVTITPPSAPPAVTAQPVASKPAAPMIEPVELLPEMEALKTYRARLDLAGDEAGNVFLVVNDKKQTCKVKAWNNKQVTFTLPDAAFATEKLASIEIVKPSGDVARQIAITLVAKKEKPQTLAVEQVDAKLPTPSQSPATEVLTLQDIDF